MYDLTRTIAAQIFPRLHQDCFYPSMSHSRLPGLLHQAPEVTDSLISTQGEARPLQDQAWNLGMCPDEELKPPPSGARDYTQPTEPHRPITQYGHRMFLKQI